jgi:hypothetical protein
MINILIIFLTQYFQKTHYFIFQSKGAIHLFYFFISMNKMDGKTTFGQLFQTRCFVEERTFLREETKW